MCHQFKNSQKKIIMAKTKWILDPTHSELGFKIKHLMITSISGSVKNFEAEVEMDETDFSSAQINLTAGMASISTNNEQRDAHLRTSDFFEVEKYPELKITFDVSHWCNVHESLLADQQSTLDMTLDRVEHIHARIGHPEGPQVNDPRAPEWENAVKAHLAWWDKVVERKKKNGERMTFLTEFGPPDYMPTMAYTRQPLANQWEINVYMMQLLRKRYS